MFGSWEGKAALLTLQEFPVPAQIVCKDVKEIVQCWRKEVSRAVGVKRAEKLIEAAKSTIGVREGLRTTENEIKLLLEEYEVLCRQYEGVLALMEELVHQIPGIKGLLSIKGVGLATVTGFIAEIGDIERFDHPKQIQKLAGLSLKESGSGKHKGKTTISKRGRRRLRPLLFQVMLPLVLKSEEFRELHQYDTTRQQNPLKKKQSLILLCCKLIRVFFALMKKKEVYDPIKMMMDIVRPALLKTA